jgi:hypothetical protein
MEHNSQYALLVCVVVYFLLFGSYYVSNHSFALFVDRFVATIVVAISVTCFQRERSTRTSVTESIVFVWYTVPRRSDLCRIPLPRKLGCRLVSPKWLCDRGSRWRLSRMSRMRKEQNVESHVVFSDWEWRPCCLTRVKSTVWPVIWKRHERTRHNSKERCVTIGMQWHLEY